MKNVLLMLAFVLVFMSCSSPMSDVGVERGVTETDLALGVESETDLVLGVFGNMDYAFIGPLTFEQYNEQFKVDYVEGLGFVSILE